MVVSGLLGIVRPFESACCLGARNILCRPALTVHGGDASFCLDLSCQSLSGDQQPLLQAEPTLQHLPNPCHSRNSYLNCNSIVRSVQSVLSQAFL